MHRWPRRDSSIGMSGIERIKKTSFIFKSFLFFRIFEQIPLRTNLSDWNGVNERLLWEILFMVIFNNKFLNSPLPSPTSLIPGRFDPQPSFLPPLRPSCPNPLPTSSLKNRDAGCKDFHGPIKMPPTKVPLACVKHWHDIAMAFVIPYRS